MKTQTIRVLISFGLVVGGWLLLKGIHQTGLLARYPQILFAQGAFFEDE